MAEPRVPAPAVLVVGDANPDLVLRGDVVPRFGQREQLLDDATFVIGGSAGITAHAFARLDRPVALAAAIGDDPFGERMRADLAAAGVDVRHLVVRPDLPTGLTVVLSTGDDRAILTRPGAIPTLRADDVRTAIDALRAVGLRHVHVSSLFLQPALAAELPGLLAEARASGLSTSLDTNDDPARTWRGLAELLPYVDVLLPNRAEATGIAGAVCGGCYDEPAAAGSALAKFCGLVVVKDGDRGAFGCTATEVMHQPPIGCEVVDTTGAGDTFDAAFLDGWLRRLPVTECLRRAVLAGGYAVGGVGGTGRQPGQHDLNTERRTR